MLYVKLSLRNLKRSLREYAIFMLTMVLSMMLIYSFMAVASSEEVLTLGEHMGSFLQVTLFVSIGIVLIIGWLISYVSGFIVRKRSREFGMYLLMGMQRKEVSRMFLLEQLFMGLVAFIIGCTLGVFVHQILQAIIQQIFGSHYQFSLTLSIKAFLITLGSFALVYLIELWRERRMLMRIRIHDLLMQDRRNEEVHKNPKLTMLYMLVGILTMSVGWKLFYEAIHSFVQSDMKGSNLMLGSGMLIVSIYCYFLGLSSFLQRFLDRFHKLKYRPRVLFLFGRLQGRLRSNRIVLATLSLLILLTLSFLSFGLKFKEGNDSVIDSFAPYDLQMGVENKDNVAKLESFFQQQGISYKGHLYQTYQELNSNLHSEATFSLMFKNTQFDSDAYQKTTYLKVSDYQRMMELKGKRGEVLKDDEYGVVVNLKQAKIVENYVRKHPFTINGTDMKLRFTSREELLQDSYYIVVPDTYLTGMQDAYWRYVANSEQEIPSSMEKDIYQITVGDGMYGYVNLRSTFIEQSMFSYVTIVFSLFYAAFIFICATGTILATQQLSDLDAQRYEYDLLSKMGASQKELQHTLALQNTIYFLIPLVLPALYLYPITTIVDTLFINTNATTSIFLYLGIAAGLFFIVYLAYYLLTYISCRRNLVGRK